MLISPINLNGIQYFKGGLKKAKPADISLSEPPKKHSGKRGYFNFNAVKSKKPQTVFQEGQIACSDCVRIFNRHTTSYFRDDLNWDEFIEILKNRFQNEKKVNTYIWGCSYGEEAYSLAMILDKKLGEEGEKFYPIQAKDISEDVIEANKKEQKEGVVVNNFGRSLIKKGLGLKYNEENGLFRQYPGTDYMKLNSEPIKKVQFETSNIVTDISSMDGKTPSLVMCRNMWPYVDPKKYEKCAKELYDTLAKGSLVVIGDYDCFGEMGYFGSKNFPKELIKAGFKPIYNLGVNHRESLSKEELKEFVLIFEKN